MNFNESFKTVYSKGLSTRNRIVTFNLAIDLFRSRKLNTIVETGTARVYKGWEDGNSSLIWSHLTSELEEGKFYSVDISNDNIERARKLCDPFIKNSEFIVSDSVQFLESHNAPIDLLFLDSMDASIPGYQEHHLNEIIQAEKNLHADSIVLIDDSPEKDYGWAKNGGKGALVIPYLLKRGWKIKLREYQTLMILDTL